MAWTSLTFGFASKLTSTKMTSLQNNFLAMANGDSGAPLITPTALGTITESTQGSTYVLPLGFWVVGYDKAGGDTVQVQMYHASAWEVVSDEGGFFWSDGVNMRVTTVGGMLLFKIS
jgi:hypothetical protein